MIATVESLKMINVSNFCGYTHTVKCMYNKTTCRKNSIKSLITFNYDWYIYYSFFVFFTKMIIVADSVDITVNHIIG